MNNNTSSVSISQKALEIAISQLGVHEQPAKSNGGPEIDQYLASVGLKTGNAWCMSFVYWCYEQAAKALGIQNPVVKTAGVHDCWNRTSMNNKRMSIEIIRKPELILPGNQGILLMTPTTGHTFLIEHVEQTTGGVYVHTVEGNSNDNGSRDGEAVVRHVRAIGSLKGVIRY